jgi:hypothetical protein
MAFDSNGDPMASAGVAGVSVSSFMEPIVQADTALSARDLLGAKGNLDNVKTVIGNYTALTTDDTLLCSSASGFTLTLFTAVGNAGKRLNIVNVGAGGITVDGNGDETIGGSSNVSLTTQYDAITIQSDGTNWGVISQNFIAVRTKIRPLVITDAEIANTAITQAKLKTSSGSLSSSVETYYNITLPGGEYGFYPQIYGRISHARIQYSDVTDNNIPNYVTNIALSSSGGYAYVRQRYVTSSGEVHWIFILRDKATKNIIAMYQAPDHPCFGNGGKPLLAPHPFGNYDPDKHEIIVINPSNEDVFNMQDACIMPEDKPDRDILEVIMENYEIDDELKTEWPKKEITVGLPRNIDWKRMPDGSKVLPVKKRIPQPSYITTRKLWIRKT